MNEKTLETDLKDLKAELKSSGLSRREAFTAAIGAVCPLLLVISGGEADAKMRCEPAGCATSCISCRVKCSDGPDGKSK